VAYAVNNPFQYFGEIEEHFQRRRGAVLLASNLDWVLMETWKDAGIPLEAVLRGIDVAFEKFEKRPQAFRKVNSLAYCAQAVLEQAEQMKEAAVGTSDAPAASARDAGLEPAAIAAYLQRNAAVLEQAEQMKEAAVGTSDAPAASARDAGLEPAAIAAYLQRNAAELGKIAASLPGAAPTVAQSTAATLHELAVSADLAPRLEDLERHLTVLEEKLFAALLSSTSDAELLAVRSDADRDLAPYRSKMTAAQIEQLHKQYVHRRLLERWRLPRLSLFYM